MSSKRKMRKNQCIGKVRHDTLKEAIAARKRTPEFGKMQSYKCRWCHAYHNGHVPTEKKKRHTK